MIVTPEQNESHGREGLSADKLIYRDTIEYNRRSPLLGGSKICLVDISPTM